MSRVNTAYKETFAFDAIINSRLPSFVKTRVKLSKEPTLVAKFLKRGPGEMMCTQAKSSSLNNIAQQHSLKPTVISNSAFGKYNKHN